MEQLGATDVSSGVTVAFRLMTFCDLCHEWCASLTANVRFGSKAGIAYTGRLAPKCRLDGHSVCLTLPLFSH